VHPAVLDGVLNSRGRFLLGDLAALIFQIEAHGLMLDCGIVLSSGNDAEAAAFP
jgi:hypothetical protein